MKIKVSELVGAKLDAWVSMATGREAYVESYEDDGSEQCWTRGDGFTNDNPYSPSTDWSQGGPIIERERICVRGPGPMGGPNPEYYWTAYIDTGSYAGGGHNGHGRTPLIAAMRCFVASKFSEEVEEEA